MSKSHTRTTLLWTWPSPGHKMFISHQCETNSDHNNPPHLMDPKANQKDHWQASLGQTNLATKDIIISSQSVWKLISLCSHILFDNALPASQSVLVMQLHSIQTYNQSVLPIAHSMERIGTLFSSPIMVGWQATLVRVFPCSFISTTPQRRLELTIFQAPCLTL
jgi:hypothetical protein